MLVVLPSSFLFCRKELGGANFPTTKKKVSFFLVNLPLCFVFYFQVVFGFRVFFLLFFGYFFVLVICLFKNVILKKIVYVQDIHKPNYVSKKNTIIHFCNLNERKVSDFILFYFPNLQPHCLKMFFQNSKPLNPHFL
jgi:hypothetical protein